MSYLTNEEKSAISRYFAPDKRITQLRQEIEQLRKGGGGSTGKVAGGVTSGIGTATGMFINLFPGMGWVADATEMSIKGIGKLAEAGGNAIDNDAVRTQIQTKTNEIQKIQSGEVNRGISDGYLDAIVENLVPDDLYEKALDALMLDELQIKEVKPIYLEDYYIDENEENQLIARGRDGIDRSLIYQVTWLFGTAKQLCVYQYTFDVETGADNETAKKYFWKNITELSNSTEIVRGNKKRFFVIKVANGGCKFAYKENNDVKRSIRGMNAFYDINNG